jgi:hypothetical protein
MRSVAVVMFVGCGSASAPPPPSNVQAPAPAPAPAQAIEKRCLPVVAKECGCVYTCGTGTRDGDHWTVTHSFWKDMPLKAKVERWCVDEACTEAFAAEIVCSGICAPKPADPTCHFDAGGACIGKEK